MNKIFCLPLALVLALAFSSAGFAQQITIGTGSSALDLGAGDFSTNADGISTLDTPLNYVSNLAADASIPAQLGLSGAGWVFASMDGTVIIADTSPTATIALADPSVSYGYYFVNTTGNDNQPFSMQFTTNFASTTFTPSLVRASFSATLTDNSPGPDPTSSSATIQQQAELGYAAIPGGALSNSTQLTVANLGPVSESASNGGSTTTIPAPSTGGYITGPSGGPFNELVVTVSGTYSANAIVAVSGRVDAVPEPNEFALFLVGTLGGLVFHWRRIAHR